MNSFPRNLTILNTREFDLLFYNHIASKLRKKIYVNIIGNNSQDFFDISLFKYNTHKDFKQILKQICSELEELGWKTKLSYGDTAVFIFKDEIPINCW